MASKDEKKGAHAHAENHPLEQVKGFDKILYIVACVGSAVVIVGALFKIMHWPGAPIMLIVGLLTEAAIFMLYAFKIPHVEWDWSYVYPVLHQESRKFLHKDPNFTTYDINKIGKDNNVAKIGDDDEGITSKLDKMLEDAKIEPQLIQDLGNGMRSLSENAGKIADISKAHTATNEYVDSVRNASQNVSHLADTYKKAADSISDLAQANDAGTSIGGSLNSVAKNLSALNASYELQLQGSQEHLKATSKFYEGLNDLMKNLSDSVEDTKKYKQEISTLSNNLNALNTIYGNMLTAMNFKNNA